MNSTFPVRIDIHQAYFTYKKIGRRYYGRYFDKDSQSGKPFSFEWIDGHVVNDYLEKILEPLTLEEETKILNALDLKY